MNATARIYAFQKVSSFQEAAVLGVAGTGLGAYIGGEIADAGTRNARNEIGRLTRYRDTQSRLAEDMERRLASLPDTPENFRQREHTRFASRIHKDAVEGAAIRTRLAERELVNQFAGPQFAGHRYPRYAARGAVALGALGAGIGLLS